MIKVNPFFIALAVYVTLFFLIVTTGMTHAVLIGILVGYLLIDRIISQIVIVLLINAAVKLKLQRGQNQ